MITTEAVRPLESARIATDTVVVIVPAHNEADQIESTLRSLLAQSRKPDWIIVVCDNCTDNTEMLACQFLYENVSVIRTSGNRFKKAGALNQGIHFLLKADYFPEYLLTIDADTILDENFIQRCLRILSNNPKLGGLSAVCSGKENLITWPVWNAPETVRSRHQRLNTWDKFRAFAPALIRASSAYGLVWLERAEYARAGATRLRHNIHTLSGAGSVLRSEAVLQVLADRGEVYAERHDNLVEDYELTLEIKRHGWKATNNVHCIAHTDLMLTLPALIRQRVRWVRGSIDELRRRGWKRETKASILAILYGYLGMPLFYLWLYIFGHAIATHDIHWQTAWILAIVCTYQAWTLREMGIVSRLVAFLLIPEQLFNFVRHGWLIASLIASFRKKNQSWQ